MSGYKQATAGVLEKPFLRIVVGIGNSDHGNADSARALVVSDHGKPSLLPTLLLR